MALAKKIFAMGAIHSLLLCAQNSGSISGHVTNSITGAGIEGAKVTACPTLCGPETTYQAVTDTTGAFRIGGIPGGQYLVMVLNGAMKASFVTTEPLPSVNVSGDSRVDLQMTPFASVRGRVLDPAGVPAAGIAVKLGFLSESITNQNGEFVFEDVPPDCCLTLSAIPKPQPAAQDGTRIVTTYYPSVVDSSQAAKIALTGLDITCDIRLRTALASAIRGVVIGTDGKPTPQARVVITRSDPGPISFLRGNPGGFPNAVEAAPPTTTNQDGTFVFPPVLEGEWVLRAFLVSRGEMSSGSAKVSVSTRDAENGDIQDVEIRMAPPFDVEVTADWGDSAPPKTRNGFAFASIIPLDSQTDLQSAMRPAAEPGKPQRFHLFGGPYFIWEGRTPMFSPAPGFYAAAAMLGGRDVLGQSVELSGPASLKMIYKSGGGRVQGTVEKGANAAVVLMTDGVPAARIGYAGRCDANGAFSIPDLPPGEYTAVAVPGPVLGDPLRPAFESALIRDGKRIKIEAGTTARVELHLALMQ